MNIEYLVAPTGVGRPVRPVRDARGYWRTVLALAAPVGWLTVGISNAFTPYPLGGTAAQNVAGVQAHQGRMETLLALQPLFLFTFVPGVLALIAVCRRSHPIFTAALGTLGLLGALAGTFNPSGDLFILLGVQHGVDHTLLAAVTDALDTSPIGWTLLFTFLFITVGRIAIGWLLWTASVGPRPLAVLMMLSPFIEFGGGAIGLGNAAPATAWIASGIAMLGVSAVLLRMPNDEFDLPATVSE